jgi:membrane associated rhomboid family serine protease
VATLASEPEGEPAPLPDLDDAAAEKLLRTPSRARLVLLARLAREHRPAEAARLHLWAARAELGACDDGDLSFEDEVLSLGRARTHLEVAGVADPALLSQTVGWEKLVDHAAWRRGVGPAPEPVVGDTVAGWPRSLRWALKEAGLWSPPSPTEVWVLLLGALLLLAFVIGQREGLAETWLDLGRAQAAAIARGELWRLVSALFLHSGWPHLVGNTVVLTVLGLLLLPMTGPLQLYLVFFGAGIAGNLATTGLRLVRDAGLASSIGASGAIMGLLGALVVSSLRLRAERGQRRHRFRRWQVVFAGTVLYLLFTGVSPGSDHAAHLFGLLGGAALGLLLRLRVS